MREPQKMAVYTFSNSEKMLEKNQHKTPIIHLSCWKSSTFEFKRVYKGNQWKKLHFAVQSLHLYKKSTVHRDPDGCSI